MSILMRVYDWWRLRKATAALRSMDEHALRDIGISREEIPHAVRFGRGREQPGTEPRSANDAASAAGYTRATKQRGTNVLQIPASLKLQASRN